MRRRWKVRRLHHVLWFLLFPHEKNAFKHKHGKEKEEERQKKKYLNKGVCFCAWKMHISSDGEEMSSEHKRECSECTHRKWKLNVAPKGGGRMTTNGITCRASFRRRGILNFSENDSIRDSKLNWCWGASAIEVKLSSIFERKGQIERHNRPLDTTAEYLSRDTRKGQMSTTQWRST